MQFSDAVLMAQLGCLQVARPTSAPVGELPQKATFAAVLKAATKKELSCSSDMAQENADLRR